MTYDLKTTDLGELHRVDFHNDLIYDFGMHLGEDTHFYLKKGFRVIAFEANPELVAAARVRFSDAIAAGKLVIVEGAIVADDMIGTVPNTVTFYANKDLAIWGTVNQSWADRNARLGHASNIIQVPIVDLEHIFLKHGMPYFMKVDIEGCDMICLRKLGKFLPRPAFVSFESDKTSISAIRSEIDLLVRLGYQQFQSVEQSSIAKAQQPPNPAREGQYSEHQFEYGSSGLFGAELPGNWYDARKIKRRYSIIRLGYYLLGDTGMMKQWQFLGARSLRRMARFAIRIVTRAPVPGWYDTHARHVAVDASSNQG